MVGTTEVSYLDFFTFISVLFLCMLLPLVKKIKELWQRTCHSTYGLLPNSWKRERERQRSVKAYNRKVRRKTSKEEEGMILSEKKCNEGYATHKRCDSNNKKKEHKPNHTNTKKWKGSEKTTQRCARKRKQRCWKINERGGNLGKTQQTKRQNDEDKVKSSRFGAPLVAA